MAGPKIRFTKDMIIDGAVDYIDKYGINKLSARNLAKHINSSTQPIFRIFSNFEELLKEVRYAIDKKHSEYIYSKNYDDDIPFLNMGIAYISFAKDHPNFFYVLFLDKYFHHNNIDEFFDNDETEGIINTLSESIGISFLEAKKLFRNIWLLTHGVASLVYAGQVKYEFNEIKDILMSSFMGILMEIKRGNENG